MESSGTSDIQFLQWHTKYSGYIRFCSRVLRTPIPNDIENYYREKYTKYGNYVPISIFIY